MNKKTLTLLSLLLFLTGCGRSPAPSPGQTPLTPIGTPAAELPVQIPDGTPGITPSASPAATAAPSPITDAVKVSDYPCRILSFYKDTPFLLYTSAQTDTVFEEDVRSLCFQMAQELGSTAEDEGIFYINNTHGDSVELTERQAAMLRLGLPYCELTGGAFDVTDAALAALWDISAEDFQLPDEDELSEALLLCDYRNLVLQDRTLSFTDSLVMLNTSSYRNGYCLDCLLPALHEGGLNEAVISFGNVSYYLSEHPSRGFQAELTIPSGEGTASLGTVLLRNYAVAGAHVAEQTVTVDGILCHPLYDIRTGYPADCDFTSVFVLSPSAAIAQMISRACFSRTFEEGNAILSEIPDTYAVYVMRDGTIRYTDGLTDCFTIQLNDASGK